MSGKVRITKFNMAEHMALLPNDWPEGVDLALRIEGDSRRLIGVHRDEFPDEYHRRIAHAENRPPRHYLLTPADEVEAMFPLLLESMTETPDLLDLGLEFDMNYDFILSEGLDEAYMKEGTGETRHPDDGKFIPILSPERLLELREATLGILSEGAAEIAFPNGIGTAEIGPEHVSQSIDGTITRIDLSGLDDREIVPALMRLPNGSLAIQTAKSRMASRGKFLFIYLDPFGDTAAVPGTPDGNEQNANNTKKRFASAFWNRPAKA